MIATQKWLKTAEEKTYFLANSRYLIPAFFISLLVALAYFAKSWLCWNDWRVVHGLMAHNLDCRRLRTGPRRFDCLEGSPSWTAIPRL